MWGWLSKELMNWIEIHLNDPEIFGILELQTYLESWNIEDFKNVHHVTVASFCQKLLASKVESKI